MRIFCASILISLGFVVFTQHIWEDYLITYRCSKNLVEGHGLVFTPGEKVHAFTSPLNTLLPAGFRWATGSDEAALWLFRLVSCAALAGSAILWYRIAKEAAFTRLAMFVLLGLLLTDAKIVDFSVNGQEIGLMMLFFAWMVYGLLHHSAWLGVAWAGLAWTRPDAGVYAAAVAGSFLLFNVTGSRRELLKTCTIAGLIALVLYSPWLIWAWGYYGSPIPHTVIAKGLKHKITLEALGEFLWRMPTLQYRYLSTVFAPHYASWAAWPSPLMSWCGFLGWIAAFFWLVPRGRRVVRAMSFAFFLGCAYLFLCTPFPFPWYLPTIAVMAIFVLAGVVQQLGEMRWKGFSPTRLDPLILGAARWGFRAWAVAIPVVSALVLLACALQLRVQQREIEIGNRMQIGLWLRENANPGDSVLLEPLGYIGYYSQLKMLDLPGLSSPEVVAARRKIPGRKEPWNQIIAELRPDWLVLRAGERQAIHRADNRLLVQDYQMVKKFDVSERVRTLLESNPWIFGARYLENDATFLVYRRRE